MSELGERDELPLAHLSFSLLHESALFAREYVIGINHSPGLVNAAIVVLSVFVVYGGSAEMSRSGLTLLITAKSRGDK